MDRVLAIANAGAGSAEEEQIEQAVTVLRDACDVELVRTAGIAELWDVLDARDGRVVVVIGGDGSLHAVVNVLHREQWLTDTTVALVPLGTGNDFSRTFEIPLDPAAAAQRLSNAATRQIDLLVEDGGEVAVNAVHIGVGVDAATEATDLKQTYGRFGYVLGAFRAGFVSKGLRLRVEVDGRVVADGRHHVLQVAVANGRFVGGGIPLAVDADPSDGLVDVVISYALAPAKRFSYAVLARLGRHGGRADVETYRGNRVVVTGPAFRWNVDGELGGPEARRAWRVQAGALVLLTG